ncbi:MAG TPA: cytosine permease [Solirubrobacteraceae bacterium]|nr:cytosine permease [Solirubrobacteraceae bacterium]
MGTTVETSTSAGAGGSVTDEPVFESRGIDYIPLAERRGKPTDLAWMWAGALLNVEYVVYGALIMSFGLRFWQAALVIVLGNLSYLIAGLGSLQGPRAGTAAFTINRAPFGPNGAKVIAGFNWMTQVGFEIEGLALVVLAGLALFNKAGVGSSTGLKVALIIAAAAIQLLLPLFGHRAMLRVLRALAIPFVILFVVLTILSVGKVHLSAGTGGSWQTMFAAVALIFSAGGYGWPMNANDFSRYLPPNASPRRIVASVAVGGYLPSTLLELLGAALYTIPAVAHGGGGAISGLPQAFSSWFIWPYLIFAIVQLFAINSVDLYSSGLTLQAIIPAIKRWQCVLLDTIVGGALTAFAVFSAGFNTFVSDFVLMILIWIAPWVAIYLVDYFMRRGRYDSRALLDPRPGIYWRTGGVHWAGLVAMGCGMAAAASFLNAYPFWTSPLTTASGGADFSVFMGAIVGGTLYWLLARRSVASEVERTPGLETEDAAIAAMAPPA